MTSSTSHQAAPLRRPIAQSARCLLATLILCDLAARRSFAQAAASPGKNATAAEAVVMSPFEVRTDRDEGYLANSSLAGGRTEMPLKDTPSAVSVMTSDFLEDLGLLNAWAADEWSVNSSSMGYSTGLANGVQADYNFTNFRGLGSSYGSRNYFLWYINSDSYSTERLEFARGPNGVLFGDGNVGGITTVWSKRALLNVNRSDVNARFDSFGGVRGALDMNRPLGRSFALRVNLLDQTMPTWRDDTWRRMHAGHLAGTWQVSRNDTVRFEGEASEDRRNLYANNYTDGASLWNRVASYNGVTAPTGTGVARISTGVYNVLAPAFSRTTLYNYQNFFTASGTGIAIQPHARGDIANFPGLPTRRINVQPPDSEARVMFKTFTTYWEHRFTDDLYLQLAFNDVINRRRTYKSETIYSAYQIDINTVLPGGGVNPKFGVPYSEGLLLERTTNNHVDDLRATLAWKSDSSWLKQRLNLIAGSRMDRFNQLQWRPMRTNGTIANVTNAANAIRVRFYWDEPARYEIGNIASIAGANFDYLPTLVTNERKRIDYRQLASTSQLFDRRLTLLLGVRQDYVEDRLRGSTGIPADPVTGLPQIGAVVPNGTTTAPVIGGRTLQQISTTSYNGGAVYAPIPLVAFALNYSESFAPPTSGANKIDGSGVGVSLSKGMDAGVRFTFLDGKIYLSTNAYRSTQTGRPDFSNTNTTELNRIWTNLGRLDLANISYRDLRDVRGEGLEFELTANPSRQLRLTANYALPKTKALNLLPGLRAYVAQNLPQWQAAANNPAVAQRAQIQTDINSLLSTLNQNQQGTVLNGTFNYTANFYATYTFAEKLKGWAVGGGFNLRGPCKIGNTLASQFDYLYARSYALASGHVRYGFRLFNRAASAQVNVSNLLNNDRLNFAGTSDYTPAGGTLTRTMGAFTYFEPIKATLTLHVAF